MTATGPAIVEVDSAVARAAIEREAAPVFMATDPVRAMPTIPANTSDDIYEASGALSSWTQIFDTGGAWLDVRDTSPTVCLVAELDNMWGFRVMNAFGGHEVYDVAYDDHYIALRYGDWVCPRVDFWEEDPSCNGWTIGTENGWTFVSTCNPETMLVEHGWVPPSWLTYSLKNQEAGTYVCLQLGCSRVQLPVSTLPFYVEEYPRCHCTIGYLPRLSREATTLAIQNGNRLIRKYINDGFLPEYTHRPHVCCKEDGTEYIAGICKYSSHLIAARGNSSSRNSFTLMRYGKVAARHPVQELVADFDHVHVRRADDDLACLRGLSIVGSLDSYSSVHELAMKLRCFLKNEVVGQLNELSFDAGHHHWSKPHLSLAKLLNK